MPFTYFVFLFLLPLVTFWGCIAALFFLDADRRFLAIMGGIWVVAFLALALTKHMFPFVAVQAVLAIITIGKLRFELI